MEEEKKFGQFVLLYNKSPHNVIEWHLVKWSDNTQHSLMSGYANKTMDEYPIAMPWTPPPKPRLNIGRINLSNNDFKYILEALAFIQKWGKVSFETWFEHY